MSIEKYGVQVDKDLTKTASVSGDKVCPICGAKLETSGPTPKCPVHGTEPFEEKKNEPS
jgi:hypothetical protein